VARKGAGVEDFADLGDLPEVDAWEAEKSKLALRPASRDGSGRESQDEAMEKVLTTLSPTRSAVDRWEVASDLLKECWSGWQWALWC
jgi:hypothetical protein